MGNVSAVGIAWRCDKRDVVIVEVVLVRVCSAFGAGFALYRKRRQLRHTNLEGDGIGTWTWTYLHDGCCWTFLFTLYDYVPDLLEWRIFVPWY